MSNTTAIAAVTSALYNRAVQSLTVDSTVSGADITILPLDKALDQPGSSSTSPHQLNIFLYHIAPSPAFRNGSPSQEGFGGAGSPPLALTLHYLVSANSNDGDDLASHRLLGAVMGSFHDRPVLSKQELGDAASTVAGSDVHLQVARVRITEQALTTEEMYKLWSAFQTHYRVSAAYEVSVVLIDSVQPIKAPMPALVVVTPEDASIPNQRSPEVVPRIDLYPLITAVTPPDALDYALPGDVLTIAGAHIFDDASATITALLSQPALPAPTSLPPDIDQGAITLTLPATSALDLPAGVYTLSLEIQPTSGRPIVTNALPFALAPEIASAPSAVALDVDGNAAIALTVTPPVRPGQRVYLLVGARGFPLETPLAAPSTSLGFSVPVAPGDYRLRVRVDGVDSPLFDPGAQPPDSPFGLAPVVTITAYVAP